MRWRRRNSGSASYGSRQCLWSASVAEWLDSLGDQLSEIHLHDNHGTADEHLR